MTKFKALLCGSAAMLSLAGTGGANAANIVLVDQGGATNTPAAQGFAIAAAYWSSVLTNNITIRLGVSYAALAPGVIGSTGSSGMDYTVAAWEAGVNATKSNSAVDANIVLPTLSTGNTNNSGAIAFITNGPASGAQAGGTGINTATFRYDNSTSGTNSVNNKVLYLNTANVKAIGGTAVYDPTNTQQLDGEVQFSSNFAFDFDPTNGVTAGTFDFIGVAIHEIGHALGFVSGVDYLDYFGTPNGDGIDNAGFNFNSTSIYSALDMFRYSMDPRNLVAGNGPVLDLAVGSPAYFSIDGGLTQFNGNSLFATGAYNGDGDQASHWKDATGANACGPQIGIMDPTFCFAQRGEVTALDLAAFDAIGYNIAADSRGTNYLRNTADIYRQFTNAGAVPETATWAMMLMGFGLVGGAMRRRKVSTSVSFG